MTFRIITCFCALYVTCVLALVVIPGLITFVVGI